MDNQNQKQKQNIYEVLQELNELKANYRELEETYRYSLQKQITLEKVIASYETIISYYTTK